MERLTVKAALAVVLLLACIAGPLALGAQVKSSERQEARKAIEKELKETLDMPILTGNLWQEMTQDAKVAFVWGFGHVVAIEQHLMEKYPEFKREDFVSKVVEGMAGIPMTEVISRVDGYYAAHPDQMEKPVVSVMWDTMIRPNVKTGIAGRPLRRDN